mgnify:CR=1 FL=1
MARPILPPNVIRAFDWLIASTNHSHFSIVCHSSLSRVSPGPRAIDNILRHRDLHLACPQFQPSSRKTLITSRFGVNSNRVRNESCCLSLTIQECSTGRGGNCCRRAPKQLGIPSSATAAQHFVLPFSVGPLQRIIAHFW